MTSFNELGLAKPLLTALAQEDHQTPTPIQAQAIPALLEGHDLLGIAQTGSGKTAAFTLPLLHRLFETPGNVKPLSPRALILTPTRELAGQVRDRVAAYGVRTSLRTGLVIGGAPINKQKNMIRRGVDILIATPGRLEDLMKQDAVSLDAVEYFVLDEVDQMLDMGFIHAIRAITAKLPEDRQSLFFSATMPREIERLANALLRKPVRLEMKRQAPPKIEQSVMFITKPEKIGALMKIAGDSAFTSGLVFSRTKHGADKIVKSLNNAGLPAKAIHGNRSQGQRERALRAFKSGKARILVATDIAARGIDIQGVSHVINFDLPNVPETYVHRIGRTARAGATGIAISFCSPEERSELRSIERLTGQRFGGPAGKKNGSRPGRKPPRRPHRKGNGKRRPKASAATLREADKAIAGL
ncbi:DEAD/DEAH box helicase [Hyphococcus flavus]|uniref:DEAD/DEAH box helicase n=1 Tax=Hyphococcus flavus TaxID=1866326 RepID=A0AAE9ZDU3_9PROT|nr:DEAD/DEAH box helicase [Hyphococcus flavus]WDI31132.1 DEAD/DEAH box helicase [Hyphococcus flavus]